MMVLVTIFFSGEGFSKLLGFAFSEIITVALCNIFSNASYPLLSKFHIANDPSFVTIMLSQYYVW